MTTDDRAPTADLTDQETAELLARVAADDGPRHTLDDVLTSHGLTRADLIKVGDVVIYVGEKPHPAWAERRETKRQFVVVEVSRTYVFCVEAGPVVSRMRDEFSAPAQFLAVVTD